MARGQVLQYEKAGAVHREETNNFAEIAYADGIRFHSLRYRELITKLSNAQRSDHSKYVEYISDRYL
jgi:hypothetical protein